MGEQVTQGREAPYLHEPVNFGNKGFQVTEDIINTNGMKKSILVDRHIFGPSILGS